MILFRNLLSSLLLTLALAGPARAAPATALIRLDTSAGPITIEIFLKQAPITAGNFLRYVEDRRFDGTTFYRAARAGKSGRGLIQGGIDHKLKRAFAPIPHEPTTRTGLKHLDGTVSMARNAPGTAMGDFFITIGPAPALDGTPTNPGYAAFGRVVGGMGTVRKILALPTYPGGYSKQTMGQSIINRVRITSAKRVR